MALERSFGQHNRKRNAYKFIFVIISAYLVYHYRETLPIFKSIRLKKKQMDSQ